MTVPYDPDFVRGEKHWSWLYWGASLAAIDEAREPTRATRSSAAISAGNNAFFVRRDVLGEIPEVSVGDAYVASRFRESRDASGALSYVSDHRERLSLIGGLPVFDVRSDREMPLAEALGLAGG